MNKYLVFVGWCTEEFTLHKDVYIYKGVCVCKI